MRFRVPTLLVTILGLLCPAIAQVVTPLELNDPKLQRLQQRNFRKLVDIGGEIQRYNFPYPFYLSRVLDVDLAKMKEIDQRSIRFDFYKGETVLEVTGNYYASYNADSMNAESRLKTTFDQVIVPILKIEVPHFPDDSEFASFAIEVSHHVREKIMGVHQEHAENVTVIIPVPSAQKLGGCQVRRSEAEPPCWRHISTLTASPYALWVHEGPPPEDWQDRYAPLITKQKTTETRGRRCGESASRAEQRRLAKSAEDDADRHAHSHARSAGHAAAQPPGHHRPHGQESRQRGALCHLRSTDFHRLPPGRVPAALHEYPIGRSL